MFPVLFAQLPGMTDVTGDLSSAGGRLAADLVAKAWNEIWNLTITIDSPIYQPLVLLGSGMAVICLILFTIKWVKDLLHDEGWRPSGELIWVIIVMILLRGPGDMNVAGLATGMRALINHTNAQISEVMDSSFKLELKLKELGDFPGAYQEALNLREYCNDKIDSEELKKCLDGTRTQAEVLLNQYRAEYWGAEYGDKLEAFIDQAWSDPWQATQDTTVSLFSGAVRLASQRVMMIVQVLLVLFQASFQHLIEMAMLLTALLGPIAVGATLLPIGGKAIYLWLTAFWSLGMCKLCLNIVTGVAAIAMHSSTQDPLVVGITLGLLAPILALGMAAGGGMAIFNSLIQAGQTAVSVAARFI